LHLLHKIVIILIVANVRVASEQGRVIIFAPERITLGEGALSLRDTVRSLLAGGFKELAIDMATTSYVDSSGIGELLSTFTTTRNQGGHLELNRLGGKVRDLLDLIKLTAVFPQANKNVDTLPTIEVSSNDVSPLKAARALPLLLSLRDNRIYVEWGIQEGVYKIRSGEDSAKSSLIIAAPHALSTGNRTLLYDQLQEFEDLLNSLHTAEEDIQQFLETNPGFILGENYRQLHSKVFLEREDDGALIPDFVLQPFDRDLCDLLELKLPGEAVVVGTRNRKRFSAAVQSAIAQLRTYRDYFEDRTNRERIFQQYGIKAYRPRLSVVIGRVPNLDPIEYRRIADGQRDVEILTYDDLLARAKRFLIV
jgi:anti-sigma B factor antagonist